MSKVTLIELIGRRTDGSIQESLSTELKSWLDPRTPKDSAKIVKACAALRNIGGGQLVVGFDDSGVQDKARFVTPFSNAMITQEYTQDALQSLISKYLAPPFQIEIDLVQHEGLVHPIIYVAAGAQSPVCCTKSLQDGVTILLRCNAVYVRSVSKIGGSGVVSSQEASHDDWQGIMRRCFESYEADIGKFVRRHLPQLAALAGDLQFESKLTEKFEESNRRYEIASRQYLDPSELGHFEFAGLIENPKAQFVSEDMLRQIAVTLPRTTGWRPWELDFPRQMDSVREYDPGRKMWRNTIKSNWGVDAWEMGIDGYLYAARCYESAERFSNLLTVDMRIDRVAEFLLHAREIAKELSNDYQSDFLNVALRWTGLAGRYAQYQQRQLGKVCSVPEVTENVRLPLDTSNEALWLYVKKACECLLACFEGFSVSDTAYQRITENRIKS